MVLNGIRSRVQILSGHYSKNNRMGSDCTGGLNTHYTAIKNTEGIRIDPCELPQSLNRSIRTLSPMSELTRCPWSTNDPLYLDYHDKEWGTPNRDGRRLFEKVILEGAQAGLSWIQILRRRENYRAAFDGFDPAKVAAYDDNDIERLVTDAGIIRNRAKIEGTVKSARAYLDLRERGQTFDDFIWQFTDGRTLKNAYQRDNEVPTNSPESLAMSKALKAEGFTFCGPTICYAFMQAIGIVNDHLVDCFRYDKV